MNPTEQKDYAILKIMEEFGEVNGRKALQKILYFVSLKTNLFSYQWNTYGPYSEELKYHLGDMILNKDIKVKKITVSAGYAQYNMKLSDDGKNHLKSMNSTPSIDSEITKVVDLLKDQTPRTMELFASVQYIATCRDGKYRNKIYDILDNLKPNKFTKTDVNKTESLLQKSKLIQ